MVTPKGGSSVHSICAFLLTRLLVALLDDNPSFARSSFNQAKPKTELEAKVYEILSHKNWGASSTLMNEIARDTFDYDKFAVITQIMWESMENQRPAAWRVVFKGLTLLEHLIKNGSERCVDDARNHGHALRALQQFNYYEGTIDRGSGVREKAKQLIEMLADDDRIREERQKARKLREKFGGVGSSSGGVSGGGGGGGGQYAGYGNDNWDSTGMRGSNGGYGDGGIGAKSSARYDEDRGSAAAGGYSGRYDNDASTKPASSAPPAPTFAALPEDMPKKVKSKKKKAVAAAPAPAEPTVDLFSFDASPAPAPATGDEDDFDTFQSAGGGGATAVASAGFSDPFAAPVQQPIVAAPMQQTQFDAFGGAVSAPMQASQFDAFGTVNPSPSQFAPSMGLNSNVMSQNSSVNVMGGNSMGRPAGNAMGIGGGMSSAQSQQQNDDDDFGDFAGASSSKAAPLGPASTNPLNKLISLDGLSKNTNKLEDKLNQPIIANAAAATFVQEKEQIQAAVKQSAKGSSMSFAGIDGLHKSSMMGSGGMGGQLNPMMPMSMGMNPSVMGSGSGSASVIGMLDPNEMMRKPAVAVQQQQQQSTMPQQGMMMNAQMPGGMMMNPQMQGGMMNPNMTGGMMNPNIQGGMMNPNMQGGMMNPNMQGGMMNPNMQAGMMNPQMMSGQGFGGMPQGAMMNPGVAMGGNQSMTNPNMMQPGFGMNGFGMGQPPNNGMSGGPMGGIR
jgi:epsin